jgi:NhaA family Na+:H+ antiporter
MASESPGGVEPPSDSRLPWLRSRRPVPRLLLQPVERFLKLEAGSASLLLGAAVVALVWNNLAAGSYEGFWTTKLELRLGPLTLKEDLRHLVNDLLMAIFFYVVALEVKREVLFGSLREPRSAAVPVAAALGTMVGAAATYLTVNVVAGGDLRGWAIPIATDIAFALGVLGLLGKRVPAELRAFLLTLAVVDDLGTIAVIALFYSKGISLAWLGGAVVLTVAVFLIQRIGVRSLVPYVALAGLLWVAVFESGVHATIAGVVLGFLTPATAFYARQETGEAISEQLGEIKNSTDRELSETTVLETSRLARESASPLVRMEYLLHPWSAYLVLPVFALANAGVPVSLAALGAALSGSEGLGIVLGLVVGAPIGGFLLAWALARSTKARLSEGLDWPAIAGVSPLKGIGFTVAIFISELAFADGVLRNQAKLAILLASVTAALLGLLILVARSRTRGET